MKLSLVHVTPLALAIALAGCGPKTDATTNTTSNTVTTSETDTGATATGNATDPAAAPASGAQTFADTAAKSDAFEIAAAKLAETNASSAGVKAFADFDKAYVASQVDAHNEALALMKAYAASGDAPTLKAAAGEIAPVVTDHLVMARALNAK